MPTWTNSQAYGAHGNSAIEVEGLTREYRLGRFKKQRVIRAVNEVSFSVQRGSVFGLLGPNGAGKTTTIRILTTLLTPSGGRATVEGLDVSRSSREIRQSIGLCFGGDRGLYTRLNGRENLEYFASLHHIPRNRVTSIVQHTLAELGLEEAAERRVEGYSRGMRQRLHIARALLSDPAVIFMDEPTIGLDPVAALELRRMIPRLTDLGKTVLLTTHYMFEADSICDDIGLINHGRMVMIGSPNDIRSHLGGTTVYEIMTTAPMPKMHTMLGRLQGIRDIALSIVDEQYQYIVRADSSDDLRYQITNLAQEFGSPINQRQPTLEEAYLDILARDDQQYANDITSGAE